MRCRGLLIVCAIATGLTGCGTGKTDPNPAALQAQAQLEAALALGDAAQRDAALAKVAHQAAVAGAGDVARTAVGKISDSGTRDAAAQAAAFALLEAGMPAAAKEVANLIEDGPMREDVLALMAKG
jgi:hypothetical protein